MAVMKYALRGIVACFFSGPGLALVVAMMTTMAVVATTADAVEDYPATSCELYVEQFAHGRALVNGTTFDWIEVALRLDSSRLTAVAPESALVVGMGAGVRRLAAAGDGRGGGVIQVSDDVTMIPAAAAGDSRYVVRFVFESVNSTRLVPGYTLLRDFGFYVSFRREDGSDARLWLQDGVSRFTLSGVFGADAGTRVSIGEGIVSYPSLTSPVYAARRRCNG